MCCSDICFFHQQNTLEVFPSHVPPRGYTVIVLTKQRTMVNDAAANISVPTSRECW